MSKRNWYTRAIHLMVTLAFLLGLAVMPGMVTAQEPPAPTLDPADIAYNVKGSIHKVCINWNEDLLRKAQIDWWLEAGVNLNPADVTVILPTGPNPNSGGAPYEETIKTKSTIDNVPCIEIRSMKRGDIHIFVKITLDGWEWTLHTEKKWGELYRTDLDVNPDMYGVQHTEIDDEKVEFPAGASGIYEETITDTVWATFLEVPDPQLVDDAIVHWWLVWDTPDNQNWVDWLMDYLAAHDGSLDDNHWAAHGKYAIADLGSEPWAYINNWVNTTPGVAVDTNLFQWDAVDVPGEINTAPNTDVWYAWAKTEDGIATATLSVNVTNLEPCTTYGVMIVVLVSYPSGSTPQDDPFNGENIVCLEKGKKEFHKAPIPVISEVKTPQLRWAGEKIVLEKDWGVDNIEPVLVDYYTYNSSSYETMGVLALRTFAAYYTLQEGAVGALEPVEDIAGFTIDVSQGGISIGQVVINMAYLGLPLGAQAVLAPLGGGLIEVSINDESGTAELAVLDGYTDTQAILWSQTEGEADVNVALYEVDLIITYTSLLETGSVEETQFALNGPILDHGFLVYFLQFEDVTLAEDVTSPESLSGIEPETSAPVAVEVRGFFDYRHSHLMATTRPEKVVDVPDSDIDVVLPAGRYVLPDDWPLIAGTTKVWLRPNFDLMDKANFDDIVSWEDTNYDHVEELGPYSPVRTVDLLNGVAEYPTIGPFSTYQLWSIDDMWVTAATVPSSAWWAGFVRNTVVPDGLITKYDAPMPQALVIFDVLSDLGTLSGLDKGDLEGYGFEWTWDGVEYQSPYYMVEIPANWQIPIGYNWMSWMRDPSWLYWYYAVQGPYDFWRDLQLGSIISNTHEGSDVPYNPWDAEVYSDNHGIAAVAIDALSNIGKVTILATAEYPYTPKRAKYGPIESEPIDVYWGPALVHLNPDFEATPRNGTAPLEVFFDPSLTNGGTLPYVKAQWDFNGDGIIDEEETGSWGSAGAIPTEQWTYNNPGTYTVRLTITDSTPAPIGPLVHTEEKIGYVTVGGGPVTITWNCPIGGQPLISPNPGAGRPSLNVAADCDEITVSGGEELWGIYYLIETGPNAGTWLWYIPGYGSSTLTQLEPGKMYFVVVSGACTLTIPQ